jgi:hypothetical protein
MKKPNGRYRLWTQQDFLLALIAGLIASTIVLFLKAAFA